MRALRPMTQEEREFAEEKHDLVINFLRCKCLPMEDYYDVVIFGYLSAVQQYFRNPPVNVPFRAMAIRAMKDHMLHDKEYNARAKRSGFTISLEELETYRNDMMPDPKQDTQRRVENKALLEQAASVATQKEASIIRLLVDGFALSEAARLLKISRSAAEFQMRNFYFRARAVIG